SVPLRELRHRTGEPHEVDGRVEGLAPALAIRAVDLEHDALGFEPAGVGPEVDLRGGLGDRSPGVEVRAALGAHVGEVGAHLEGTFLAAHGAVSGYDR